MRQSLLSGVVVALCACITMVAVGPLAGNDKAKEKLRYSVQQVEKADLSAIYVTDLESQETISIVNGAKHGGAFIAFYDGRDKTAFPRLAISASGFQIKNSDGKIRHVNLDELANLNRDPVSIEPPVKQRM